MDKTKNKQKSIKWSSVKKNIDYLIPYYKNPRCFTERGLKSLESSLKNFGLADPIIIDVDNTILGGHARVLKLKEMKIKEVDCRIPNRKLTDKEREQIVIRLNRNIAGEWDFDILANQFDQPDLIDWGFEKWEVGEDVGDFKAEDEWKGMPEFYQENLEPESQIIVSFKNQKDREKFAKLIDQSITPKTKSIWYPAQEREEFKNLSY